MRQSVDVCRGQAISSRIAATGIAALRPDRAHLAARSAAAAAKRNSSVATPRLQQVAPRAAQRLEVGQRQAEAVHLAASARTRTSREMRVAADQAAQVAALVVARLGGLGGERPCAHQLVVRA